jgi:SOS response regulatory protein OraA/RecX
VATVLFVKPDDKKKRVNIGITDEDGTTVTLTVKERTYTSLGSPIRGDEIGERELSDMRFDDEVIRAFRKAVSLIADVDRSRYELRAKLSFAGYSAEAVDIAISACERYGYLDEVRQLEHLVEREANRKLRGKYYIKRKLMSKGYSSSDIDRVTRALVERGEVDFDANFRLLAEKKCLNDENMITALKYKYGYKI